MLIHVSVVLRFLIHHEIQAILRPMVGACKRGGSDHGTFIGGNVTLVRLEEGFSPINIKISILRDELDVSWKSCRFKIGCMVVII